MHPVCYGWRIHLNGRALPGPAINDRMEAQRQMLYLAGISPARAPWEEYDDDGELVSTGLPAYDLSLDAYHDYLEDQLCDSPLTTSETSSTTSTHGIFEMHMLRSSRLHTCPIRLCSSSTKPCGHSIPTSVEALTA